MKTLSQRKAAVEATRKWRERNPRTPEDKARAATQVRCWRERNPGKARTNYRNSNLVRAYGITIEQYDKMLSEQKGVCAICSGTCPSGRRLAVDHDHSTGVVRGLLCARCNAALGGPRERPELFQRALAYLAEHKR